MHDIYPRKLQSDNRPDKPQSKPRRKVWPIILLIILITLALFVAYVYIIIMLPIDKNSSQNIVLEISERESTFEIADELKEKNLIRSPWVFVAYIKYKKTKLLPGIYYLRQNINFGQIILPISEGNIQEYKITIPEGWRIEQISQYLKDKNIVSSSDFNQVAKEKEGYLFPDTYRIAAESSATDIINKMIDNFYVKTKDLKIDKDKIILASIVEREAKNDEERARIAGVYQNRLDNNMKLEADPTVQYAKGNWEAPTVSDYTNVDSAYNTYLHKGLPPGPICNPGLASIEAALDPEEHDYFYFFHSDKETIFSKTKEEHSENKIKYLN